LNQFFFFGIDPFKRCIEVRCKFIHYNSPLKMIF